MSTQKEQPQREAKNQTSPDKGSRKLYQQTLLKAFLPPILILLFLLCSPLWLGYRVKSEITKGINRNAQISQAEKTLRIAAIEEIDLAQVCRDNSPKYARLREALQRGGVVARFDHMRLALRLCYLTLGILAAAIAAMVVLNRLAKGSAGALIGCYRLSWGIAMLGAVVELFLLIPLLVYSLYELTVLAADRFYPQLLAAIAIGGLVALWRILTILFKRVPLEFKEPMARAVSPEEAPELWAAVRKAADTLQTAPPDRIILGMQFNFYVTELAVLHDGGKTEGRTLYLSYPLLKQFSEAEVLAIIGHELGHFIGEDTRLTRDFFPLRLKVNATMIALAQAAWAGWSSFQFLNFFRWCFALTEQEASRSRELLADQVGARLTSARTLAGALLKLHVYAEAFSEGLKSAVKNQVANPLELEFSDIVRERLLPNDAFWNSLFEKNLPHPLDSHPSLRVRLEALGREISVNEAQAVTTARDKSAHSLWLKHREGLFEGITRQATEAFGKMKSRLQITQADSSTEEGKAILESHFPERRWKANRSHPWKLMGLPIVFAVFGVAVPVMADDLTLRIVFAGLGIVAAYFCVIIRKRHRDGALSLTAERIEYTGWTRPLELKQVANMTATRHNSNLLIVFHLKSELPPIVKSPILKRNIKRVSLSLNGFEEPPMQIGQTILRYFTRQIDQ
jgi:Zn-dependent protease with chaperone function